MDLPPRASKLQQRIRASAQDEDNVNYNQHADQRSWERDITLDMMYRALQSGYSQGNVEPGEFPGEWITTMLRRHRGTDREYGATVAIGPDDSLFVITLKWIDPS